MVEHIYTKGRILKKHSLSSQIDRVLRQYVVYWGKYPILMFPVLIRASSDKRGGTKPGEDVGIMGQLASPFAPCVAKHSLINLKTVNQTFLLTCIDTRLLNEQISIFSASIIPDYIDCIYFFHNYSSAHVNVFKSARTCG